MGAMGSHGNPAGTIRPGGVGGSGGRAAAAWLHSSLTANSRHVFEGIVLRIHEKSELLFLRRRCGSLKYSLRKGSYTTAGHTRLAFPAVS